jgi:predicted metal-dependent hydrolase
MRGAGSSGFLFDPAELRLHPGPQARLRLLARTHHRSRLTARERGLAEEQQAMRTLQRYAADLTESFGLRLLALQPERPNVRSRYGICYEDGLIRIRLRHARTGRMLKDSSLVDTLCHELAHLRHMNHGLRFRALYRKILERARQLGYYRPGASAAAGSQQVLPFDEADCGVRSHGAPVR